jgi:copper chaperone NosL
VPGMSYQPPFIGSKQLLNINATSLPWIGSAFIGMSVLLFGFSYLNERKNKGIQA